MDCYPSTIALNTQFRIPVYCRFCGEEITLPRKNQKYCNKICNFAHRKNEYLKNVEIKLAKENISRINNLHKIMRNLNDCGYYVDKKGNEIVLINEESNRIVKSLQEVPE